MKIYELTLKEAPNFATQPVPGSSSGLVMPAGAKTAAPVATAQPAATPAPKPATTATTQPAVTPAKTPSFAGPGGYSNTTPATAVAPVPATVVAPRPVVAPKPAVAPATAVAPKPAPATAAAPTTAQNPAGFNAANIMKLPGMEKYATPATAPAAKTANFAQQSTGYAKVNQPTTVKYSGVPTTKSAAPVAAPAPATAPATTTAPAKPGIMSRISDFANQKARDYMSSKTGVHPDWFKSTPKPAKPATPTATTTTAVGQKTVPGTTSSVGKTPEQIRIEKQKAAATVAQQQMATSTAQPTAQPAAQSPEQIRKQKQAAAAQAAQAQMAKQSPQPTATVAPKPIPITAPGSTAAPVGFDPVQAKKDAQAHMDDFFKRNPALAASSKASDAAYKASLARANTAAQAGYRPGQAWQTTAQQAIKPAIKPSVVSNQPAVKNLKVSAPPKPGAPTSAEYANLEKRLQQAMTAQGQVK